MKRLLAWILLFFALPTTFSAPGIQAWFDRDTISLGDTVTLTVEAAEDSQAEPDLEPLEKNFQILGTSTSTQLQIINGRQTTKTQWVVELEPTRSGTIQVPPLTIGNGQTAPLTLSVKARSSFAGKDPSQQALFLEAEADSQAPYIQSQVRFTIRLFYNEPILEGGLDVPDVKDAIIERLGEDVAYSTLRSGKRYGVIERRYVLFPQRSGTLTIPPVGFEGRIRTTDDWRFGLGLRLGRRVRLSSEPVTLQVRPRPASYTGKHWLPTPQLTLRENWPAESPRLKVGEPLTRTLILEAKGLTAAQLPTLRILEQPNIRLYADQPKTETRQDGDTIVGHREERIAVIPTESGELVLPEMTLTWWDTNTNQERVTRLPARTMTVLPAVEEAASPLIPPAQSSEQPNANTPPQSDALPSPTLQDVFWPGVSAVLLGLWLLTLLIWWGTNRSAWTLPQKNSEPEFPSVRDAKRALQRACYQGDPHAAAKALLQWASTVWRQPPKNLGELADRLATDSSLVRDLDRRLYSASAANSWHGGALWLSVKRGLKEKEEAAQLSSTDLPPLYPNN